MVRDSKALQNTAFRKLNLFPCSDEASGYMFSGGSVRVNLNTRNRDEVVPVLN
jgi:hypothetical protein